MAYLFIHVYIFVFVHTYMLFSTTALLSVQQFSFENKNWSRVYTWFTNNPMRWHFRTRSLEVLCVLTYIALSFAHKYSFKNHIRSHTYSFFTNTYTVAHLLKSYLQVLFVLRNLAHGQIRIIRIEVPRVPRNLFWWRRLDRYAVKYFSISPKVRN